MKSQFSQRHFALSFALSFALLGASLAAPAWAQTITPIGAVQGTTDVSPFDKQIVTVEGVVTGDFQAASQFSGFYIQDGGDGNPATSDGLFVYVGARSKAAGADVQVGQRVRVTGRVAEFRGQTQIVPSAAFEVLGQEAAPAPIAINLPLPAGTSFEQYEDMLVTFPQKLVVTEQGQLSRYGSLTLAYGGRLFVPTNQAPLGQIQDEGARRSFVLDDGSGAQSPKPAPYLDENGTRRVGSTTQNLVGILSFTFDKFALQPTMTPVFEDANPRPQQVPSVGGALKVGAANVHNYWTTFKNAANPDARGAKNEAEFARQSANTVAELKGLDADVLGLMELENNGEVSIDDLLGKLNAAYGAPVYARVPDLAGATSPGPIKVGLIYKVAAVAPRGAPIVDKDAVFDRYPLAQTFVQKSNGAVFTVVVNHFKSKGSGPETGDVDKGEGAWNQKRVKQAAKLLDFIKTLQTSTGDKDVLSVGDYNAYTEEAPVLSLRGGGLEHLNLRLAPEERYSFGFDGRYGSLDHAFATPELARQVTGFTEWHINADEPYFLDYPYVKGADFKASPFRASDHDPLLIGLDLKADAPAATVAAKAATKKPTVTKVVAKKPTVRKAAPKKPAPKKAAVRKR